MGNDTTNYYPVKVTVKLKKTQFTGEYNKWLITISGEDRVVTMQSVQWYCRDASEAVNSFNQEQVESFIIESENIPNKQ